jgi:SnoaL-like domain
MSSNPHAETTPEIRAFTAPQELHDLAYRYAAAIDALDAELLSTVFTRDGAVRGYGENPIEFEGAEGLARMIGQVDTAFQKTMHNVFNQTFDRTAEGAVTGLTNCIASHIQHGDEWNLMDMAIRYHNRYAQENGAWKFAERRLEVIWVETRPVQKFTATMMDASLREFK